MLQFMYYIEIQIFIKIIYRKIFIKSIGLKTTKYPLLKGN